MSCNYAEKISMMIDGELPAEESEKIRAHVESCADCQSTAKDFLFLGRQIREPVSESFAGEFELPVSDGKTRRPAWRKGSFFPVPVFGLVLLLFIGLGIWFLVVREEKNIKTVAENQPGSLPPQNPNSSGEFSLAHFDKGGRAEIYIAPRQEGK